MGRLSARTGRRRHAAPWKCIKTSTPRTALAISSMTLSSATTCPGSWWSPTPWAEAAGRVMGADKTNLIFDQLLVKEPGTSTETVGTRFDLAGRSPASTATLWLALDPVTAETGAVEYLKGSHRWVRNSWRSVSTPRKHRGPAGSTRHRGRARPARHRLLRFGAGRLHHSPRRHPHHAPGKISSDGPPRLCSVGPAMTSPNPRPNLMAMNDLATGAGSTARCRRSGGAKPEINQSRAW